MARRKRRTHAGWHVSAIKIGLENLADKTLSNTVPNFIALELAITLIRQPGVAFGRIAAIGSLLARQGLHSGVNAVLGAAVFQQLCATVKIAKVAALQIRAQALDVVMRIALGIEAQHIGNFFRKFDPLLHRLAPLLAHQIQTHADPARQSRIAGVQAEGDHLPGLAPGGPDSLAPPEHAVAEGYVRTDHDFLQPVRTGRVRFKAVRDMVAIQRAIGPGDGGDENE